MAYYSSSGSVIKEGAAGLGAVGMSLGEFFDAGPGADAPSVHAFQDGVFGGGSGDIWTSNVGGEEGPLTAFRDGSLGQYEQASAGIGYPLFVDGVPVDRPVSIYHGPPGLPGAVRGMGAVAASAGMLDLSDPATVQEFKSALALANADVTLTQEGQAVYTESWYRSPVWDTATSDLYSSFVQKLLAATNAYSEADLAVNADGGMYPTVAGVQAVVVSGVGSPGYGGDPNYFATNFPILHAFVQKLVASGGDTSAFTVKAPFFSDEELTEGKEGLLGMSTKAWMAVAGVGAIGIVAGVMFFKRRR